MIRQKKLIQLSSVVFHIGICLMLFVVSGISVSLLPTTESIISAEGFDDRLPNVGFSDETLVEKDDFVDGFGRNGVETYNVPVPTLALLFPLALTLWAKRCRWFIEKRQNFFAFPVF